MAFWAFFSFYFGLLGLHFLFLAFPFHFGVLGLYFLSFLLFGPSFPFIFAFWALVSFYFGLVGLYLLVYEYIKNV